MKNKLFMILIVLTTMSAPGLAGAAIPLSERNALIDLYTSTTGTGWTNSTNWNGAAGTECTWYGVTCDAGLTHVTQIDLNSNKLAGPIPTSIGNFPSLTTLYLYSNQLSGTIPIELGNLTNLQILYLSGNQLTGVIPVALGNLGNLQRLYLSSNKLTGEIPVELANLTNLLYLYLDSNQISGAIPAVLGNMTSLRSLALSWNQLTGTIPVELGNLVNLVDLYLNDNMLTGSIPAELGNLTKLVSLYLYVNKLNGAIPPELGSLLSLQSLYSYFNQLTGVIPSELGNLTNLKELTLENNQLTGSIPAELGNLTKLQYLSLYHNQLTGVIPSELGNLTNLVHLILSRNQLAGAIPAELGNLTMLQSLSLLSNQLTGPIPASLANLTALTNNYTDFRWNALYTSDAALKTFLDSRQAGGDWVSTQTIAPPNLAVSSVTENTATLNWSLIPYIGDTGGYEVYYSTALGGSYSLFETTADKSVTNSTVTGLLSGNTYYFKVRTKTDSHANNTNTVYSEFTTEISSQTTGPNIQVSDSLAPQSDLMMPFGNVTEGNTSEQTVTLINSGNMNLDVGAIASVNQLAVPFSIINDNCSNKAIAPAGTCAFTVKFAPNSTGDFSDSFDILSNDPDTPSITISVSGTGTPIPVPDISVSDTIVPESDLQMAFGNITEGVTSPVQTVMIANMGSADLAVSGIQLTGTNSDQFVLDPSGGTSPCASATPTIAAGNNCTVTVSFSPKSTGPKSATLAITSNDPDEATVNMALSGTGLSSVKNNAPASPALVFPADGQTGLGTTVEFRWSPSTDPDGDAVSYILYYCTDQSFTGCTPVTVASAGAQKVLYAGIGTSGLLFSGFVFANGRRRTALIAAIMIISLAAASCGGGGGGSSAQDTTDITYTASGLTAGTTYYWKVAADDGNGGVADSAVWSFTTE